MSRLELRNQNHMGRTINWLNQLPVKQPFRLGGSIPSRPTEALRIKRIVLSRCTTGYGVCGHIQTIASLLPTPLAAQQTRDNEISQCTYRSVAGQETPNLLIWVRFLVRAQMAQKLPRGNSL